MGKSVKKSPNHFSIASSMFGLVFALLCTALYYVSKDLNDSKLSFSNNNNSSNGNSRRIIKHPYIYIVDRLRVRAFVWILLLLAKLAIIKTVVYLNVAEECIIHGKLYAVCVRVKNAKQM